VSSNPAIKSATARSISVAAIQLVSTGDIAANFTQIRNLMQRQFEQHALDLVVLPENALCFDATRYLQVAQHADDYLAQCQALAREFGCALIVGSMPWLQRPDGTPTDGRCRTACMALDRTGSVVGRYDKIHLFDVDVGDAHGSYRESESFEPGNQSVVVELAGVRIGLSICYDLRFPHLFQALRRQGAELIVVPAAFTHKTGEAHWESLLRARAIENQCYVVGPNQGGRHSTSRETWGHSMIVSPWGEIMAHTGLGPDLICAQADLERLAQIRRDLPCFEHIVAFT